MTEKEKMYEEFDLLSPLSCGKDISCIRADGAAYETKDGQTLVDFNEMRVVLGQGNKAFEKAMAQAMAGITAPKVGAPEVRLKLYRYLDETTEGDFSAVHLVSSGSEAAEWAVRLAKKMTGKPEVLSFWNSIHGRTYLSASMSGLPRRKAGHGALASGTVFLPYPNCAHCPVRKSCGSCGFACLELAKEIYRSASAQEAAAVILEPYQGNGVVLPPEGYLKKLQDWSRSEGMLVIVDEVQSGMGRTGWMYRYRQEGLEPDMLLLGKGLGNGMHIAAILLKERPPVEALYALSGGAGDDPLACAAACQVFEQLEDGLLAHIREAGAVLNEGMKALENSSLVLECRGIGLAAAMEFREKEVCGRAVAKMEERGYLPGQTDCVLYCKPPYVVTKTQIQGFLRVLSETLAELEAEAGERSQKFGKMPEEEPKTTFRGVQKEGRSA